MRILRDWIQFHNPKNLAEAIIDENNMICTSCFKALVEEDEREREEYWRDEEENKIEE